MSWSLVGSGHFTDPDTAQELEVRLDELVRDFAETLLQEFGDHQVAQLTVTSQFLGTADYVGDGASAVRPSSLTTPGESDFLDESVVDDAEDPGDDGLGGDDQLPGDASAPDAGVINDLTNGELVPNPEDQTYPAPPAPDAPTEGAAAATPEQVGDVAGANAAEEGTV